MTSALSFLAAYRPECRDPINTIVADYLGGTTESWRPEFSDALDDLCYHFSDLDYTEETGIHDEEYKGKRQLSSLLLWRIQTHFGEGRHVLPPNPWRQHELVMRELVVRKICYDKDGPPAKRRRI
jgi:hypothetical protein